MINVGALVKVNTDKAIRFKEPWVLRYEGIGIIVKLPKQWFGSSSGFDILGGNSIGWNNPNGDTIVEFPKGQVRIPSTWLTIVERT